MARGQMISADRETLRRQALLLVWIGLVWNLVEAAVALWSGVRAGSVALLAFGLDSILIEVPVGLVLIWRLRKKWGQGVEKAADKKALRLVGITFFLLSVYILFQSLAILLGGAMRPQESMIGVAIVVASAVLMTVLYFWKASIATKLGSRALRAEAVESLVCDLQDLTVLVGLGLNALLGWWWADPVAALALIPFLLKEGREAVIGH